MFYAMFLQNALIEIKMDTKFSQEYTVEYDQHRAHIIWL